MIRHTFVVVSIISVSFAVAGCGNGGAKAKEEAPSSGSAATMEVKLPKLGLTISAGDGATVGDGIGADSQMIQSAWIGAMQVEVAKTPQSLDDAKSDASSFSPKNLQAETLPDGWALTYENTGSMGANYFVTVRRDLGGKSYTCSTTGSDPKLAKAALAACKSLRK